MKMEKQWLWWTNHLRQLAAAALGGRRHAGLAIAAGLGIVLTTATVRADCAAPSQWEDYVDPRFGVRIELPLDCFSPQPPPENGSGRLFLAEDGEVRLAIYATDSPAEPDPAGLKRWLTEEVGGYDEVTYAPMGRSWLVLSGYRGEEIFYEKYMFSDGGRLMSSFWVTFPRQRKPVFDPIIGRMEDSFRPGDGG